VVVRNSRADHRHEHIIVRRADIRSSAGIKHCVERVEGSAQHRFTPGAPDSSWQAEAVLEVHCPRSTAWQGMQPDR
jgi:hypothetical protein